MWRSGRVWRSGIRWRWRGPFWVRIRASRRKPQSKRCWTVRTCRCNWRRTRRQDRRRRRVWWRDWCSGRRNFSAVKGVFVMPTRRLFLKSSALAMFGVGAVPTWLGRALYAKEAPAERKKILIAIFQRGAVDGLNVVIPHGEPAYYAMRPTIAIPRPDGTEQSAIDLDGHFGLHPALKSLKPLWDSKQLAIIEAAGSPDPTRSH